MKQIDKIINCFPLQMIKQVNNLDDETLSTIEEIRIYKGKSVQLITRNNHISISGKVNDETINNILNNLMKYSYYSYEDDIAKGFITVDGGHRVGICGKAVLDKGCVKLLREISSLNIRCAKEIIGCSDKLYSLIIDDKHRIRNTLIVSPPGCGKTTLLRDLTRKISIDNYKVAICDERSEIAGMVKGESSYSFGKMVDVLDGCPKEDGIIMLIRSMSPDVIVTDEIGKKKDVTAIKTCLNCGVSIITSIHGESMEDLKKSEVYETIEKGMFSLIVFLTNIPKVGTIREVLND